MIIILLALFYCFSVLSAYFHGKADGIKYTQKQNEEFDKLNKRNWEELERIMNRKD